MFTIKYFSKSRALHVRVAKLSVHNELIERGASARHLLGEEKDNEGTLDDICVDSRAARHEVADGTVLAELDLVLNHKRKGGTASGTTCFELRGLKRNNVVPLNAEASVLVLAVTTDIRVHGRQPVGRANKEVVSSRRSAGVAGLCIPETDIANTAGHARDGEELHTDVKPIGHDLVSDTSAGTSAGRDQRPHTGTEGNAEGKRGGGATGEGLVLAFC